MGYMLFLFPSAVLDTPCNQKQEFLFPCLNIKTISRCYWACISHTCHRSWMIKLGSNIFVALECSMLISGSSQLKKGMLSIAVYDKLAQAYRQFQVTLKLVIKNRSELHWHILAPWKFSLHIHFAGFVKFAFTTVMKIGFDRTWLLNLSTVKNVLLMMYFRSAS